MVGAEAQEYELRLLRPATVGDTYRIQAICHQSQKIKLIRGGQEVDSQSIEFFTELAAGVRILEVTRDGYATKFTLSVTKFTKTQGEAKITLIPSDSLVVGSVTDAGYGFEVSGSPISPETHESLIIVIQLGKGGRWSDDEIYESKQLQKVGNRWKINTAVAARNIRKKGIGVQEDDITGTATLAEIAEIDGTPCLKVRGQMTIKRMSFPFMPDYEIESAEMHMAYSATFPVDIAKGRLQESQDMKMNSSMRRKPDASGIEVILQSIAERTLTTNMTYRE